MHLADGILSTPMLLTGATLSVVGITIGLKKLQEERIPQVALLTSTFFVASLIHLPLGPASIHLVLNGLIGLLLGWATFPAILIALFLQMMLFGFGGLTVLGINTFNMAFPALLCFYLFGPLIAKPTQTQTTLFCTSFVAGALTILLSSFLLTFSLWASGQAYQQLTQLIFIAHLPLMVTEGLITGTIVTFLRQVRPELLSQLA